ncbi:MAG: T9SS type A sorting domain-containing protein, partial [Bacteroidia bacterium]|nr:T9SS type A sorting domain-containing protein [Bacteroidia bacterium]
TVNPLPILSLTPQEDTVCVNSTINILFGTPPGGTYFGFAVTGNNFNAAFAGAGTHSVSYRYTDSNGCTDTITVSVFVDLCTGVESLNNEVSITDIFPNPVTNELTIVSSQVGIEIVNVYDVLGEKVLHRTLNGENKVVIDVGAFAAGVYFIAVKDDKNNSVTRKIMKF